MDNVGHDNVGHNSARSGHATSDGARSGEILYQGHASLRIITKAGTVVYIDPFAGVGYDVPADLILITHEHYDHNAVDKPAKKPATVIWREKDFMGGGGSVALARVARGLFSKAEPGLESKTFEDMGIQAVAAYNGHHPKGFGVGYVLNFDGITVYFAGDTSTTDEMAELASLHLDYAFLPMDGIYNMGPAEMMDCARLVGAARVIPYHVAPGELFDAAKAAEITLPNVLVLEPGQVIDY